MRVLHLSSASYKGIQFLKLQNLLLQLKDEIGLGAKIDPCMETKILHKFIWFCCELLVVFNFLMGTY